MRIAAGLAAIVLTGLLGTPSAKADECAADRRWGLVIDAGSSGSRLYYYCWSSSAEGELPAIEDLGSVKHEPGIADPLCRRTPHEAADSLRPLFEAARERIGAERLSSTPISLLATAGLRQCPIDYQQRSLAAIRSLFDETDFLVGRVDLISGREEALFGWTAVNYLLDRLGGEEPTVGALDLGGVSTQITFQPTRCNPDAPSCGDIAVGGDARSIYTHSYLGWGQDEAMRRVASRACSVRGYRSTATALPGRGRFAACKRAIRRAMKKRSIGSDSQHPSCSSSCNKLATYQPPLSGEFVAFSAFAYTAGFLDLASTASIEDLEQAGKAYCASQWWTVENRCAASGSSRCEPSFLNRYCFSSAYIVTLLHDVYGLPMRSSGLTSTNELGGFEINWTLGAMLELAQHHSGD